MPAISKKINIINLGVIAYARQPLNIDLYHKFIIPRRLNLWNFTQFTILCQ